MTARLSVGGIALRVAGAMIAVGYLFGVARGPVVGIVGALALATTGRLLLCSRGDSLIAGAAIALLAGGLGIGALRWGELDLQGMQGIQSVLGPTLLVGPPAAAGATWAGAAASSVALGAWMTTAPMHSTLDRIWVGAEALIAALAVTSVFWGESGPVVTEGATPILWIVALIATMVAGLLGWGLLKLRPAGRWFVLGGSGLVVTAAAGVLAGVL